MPRNSKKTDSLRGTPYNRQGLKDNYTTRTPADQQWMDQRGRALHTQMPIASPTVHPDTDYADVAALATAFNALTTPQPAPTLEGPKPLTPEYLVGRHVKRFYQPPHSRLPPTSSSSLGRPPGFPVLEEEAEEIVPMSEQRDPPEGNHSDRMYTAHFPGLFGHGHGRLSPIDPSPASGRELTEERLFRTNWFRHGPLSLPPDTIQALNTNILLLLLDEPIRYKSYRCVRTALHWLQGQRYLFRPDTDSLIMSQAHDQWSSDEWLAT